MTPAITSAQAALDAALSREQAARSRHIVDYAPAAQRDLAAAVAERQKAEQQLEQARAANTIELRTQFAAEGEAEDHHVSALAVITRDATRAILDAVDYRLQMRAARAEAEACHRRRQALAAQLGDAPPPRPSVGAESFTLCDLLAAELPTSPPERQLEIQAQIRAIEPSWTRHRDLVASARQSQDWAAERRRGARVEQP